MSIKDKLLGDTQEIMGRANKKIKEFEGVTSKLLLPGFKQIESDLKDLGVLNDITLDVNQYQFILDVSSSFIIFSYYLDPVILDENLKPMVGGYFVFTDLIKGYNLSLPQLPSDLELVDDSNIYLDATNINSFEKHLDDLIDYITRNSQLIIDTIEDATIEVLKRAGKL